MTGRLAVSILLNRLDRVVGKMNRTLSLVLCFVALLWPCGVRDSLVHAALDDVRGPREHPVMEVFGYDFESTKRDLDTQLLKIAPEGDNNLVEIADLITQGANPNTYDENHFTPLHYAVIKDQRLAVTVLTQRGAFVDARDAWMRTPLHFAAVYGFGETNPSTVTALYHAGANMNAGDQSDNTPLHLAASEGRTKTTQQLVEYGSFLEPINRWAQNTPLGEALLYGHTETADALRALGAVNESVSFLETERKRCRGGDDHRVCENATTDCPNFVVARDDPNIPEPTCEIRCDDPPCEAKCMGDESSLDIPGDKWGCVLNNFFPGFQPILDPFPPTANPGLGVIQGTTVS